MLTLNPNWPANATESCRASIESRAHPCRDTHLVVAFPRPAARIRDGFLQAAADAFSALRPSICLGQELRQAAEIAPVLLIQIRQLVLGVGRQREQRNVGAVVESRRALTLHHHSGVSSSGRRGDRRRPGLPHVKCVKTPPDPRRDPRARLPHSGRRLRGGNNHWDRLLGHFVGKHIIHPRKECMNRTRGVLSSLTGKLFHTAKC